MDCQLISGLSGRNSRLDGASDEHAPTHPTGLSAQDLTIKMPSRLRPTIFGTGNVEVVPATVGLDHEGMRQLAPVAGAEIPAQGRPHGSEYRRM